MPLDIINRALNKVSRTITDFRYSLNMMPPTRYEGKRVVMYHGVDLTGNKEFNLRFLSTADFEKQIKYFSKYCNVLSIKDYFNKKYKKNAVNLAITFDDGLLNNYKYALPILKKYNVPATFFVTGLNKAGIEIMWADYLSIAITLTDKDINIDNETYVKKGKYWVSQKTNKTLHQVIKDKGTLEFKNKVLKEVELITPAFLKDNKYYDYWKLMSDDDIIEASRCELITIGSHAYYHNNLGNIPIDDAIDELKKSKEYIENLTQKPCESIGYPDGSYTREVIDAAFDIGYKYQLAAAKYHFKEDINDNRIEDRFGVYPAVSSPNIIKNIVNDLYQI